MNPVALCLDLLDELELPEPEDFDDDPDPADDWGDESGCCRGTVGSRMPEKPARTLELLAPLYSASHGFFKGTMP